jgi:hypothetical protein
MTGVTHLRHQRAIFAVTHGGVLAQGVVMCGPDLRRAPDNRGLRVHALAKLLARRRQTMLLISDSFGAGSRIAQNRRAL